MSNINEENKILSVKNLRVSFWTNNGTVKAVRGVSFDLYRGRTLAIVGESGSGKSQTSRAIMGILAPNKIIEEGEILYDGRDILRLKEEELTKIRGSKIAMIFQDPMSSLNPIMKVGKQITEAMMLKKKSTIKENKKRATLLENTLLKYDPSAKESILKVRKGEEVDPSLLNAANKAVTDNESSIKEAAIKLKEKLSSLLEKTDIFKEASSFPLLHKELHEIESLVKPVENHLDDKKDDLVFTFVIALEYYLSEYKKSLAREKEEAKKKEKHLDTNSVKERAWASEIDISKEAVQARAKAYVESFIKHLEEDYITKEVDVNEKAKKLLESYARSSKEALLKISKKQLKEKAIELLGEVGIKDPEKRIKQYPFEFSGGMRQRIVIAIALSSDPEILICDEPTTALDVTIQAQILDMINDLKEKRHLSVIFITHNLGVVANMADDIAIMYAGKIVEKGTADDIFYHPAHPYTWALLSSMPDLETKDRLDSIPGTPPNMILPPKGDAFAARNKYAMQIDFEEEPPFFDISPTHKAASWLLDPRAPKVKPPKGVTDRIKRFAKLNAQREKEEKKNGKEKEE